MLRLRRTTATDGARPTRRDLLQIGGVGLWGLTLGGLADGRPVAAEDGAAASGGAAARGAVDVRESPRVRIEGFGKAKRCILVYLFGAAPQHETFDPKPGAPAEIQGELGAIGTSLSGVAFGEGLPKLAKLADRLTTVRSMTHPYPLHGVAYALSGLPVYTTDLETRPRDQLQWPYVGSVADWYWSQHESAGETAGETADRSPELERAAREARMLRHVGLPWTLNSQTDDLGLIAGPYGAFLGQRHDPIWAKYTGRGVKLAPKCRHEQAKEYQDPYAECSRDGAFVFDGYRADSPAADDSPAQLRRSLLRQFDAARVELDRAATVREFQSQKLRAYDLLTSSALREALDVAREPQAVREQYGWTLFGQSCLAARRLVEAGGRFVSVFWDAYGTYFSGGWDTHQNHYPRLKNYLLPGFDQAFAALIGDLERRGLLEDTLVVCTTEHGRTPQIDSKPVGAARHHWSKVYSSLLAGGGARRGAVVGASDRHGAEVADCPISPKDLQATALHLLGVPPETLMHDRVGRPHPLAGDGKVRAELIG